MFFLVNEEYGFLIGWSAKCGCSLIKRWFAHVSNLEVENSKIHEYFGYGNKHYSKIKWGFSDKYNDYKKYIVIRNPYSRLVSGYINKYVIEKAYPINGWNNFLDFVTILENDLKFKLINKHHFTAQTSEAYVHAEKRNWCWDKIIDLSSIDFELKAIENDLNLKRFHFSTINKTQYQNSSNFPIKPYLMNNKEIRKYMPKFTYFYDDFLKEKVRYIYSKDFKTFQTFGIEYTI